MSQEELVADQQQMAAPGTQGETASESASGENEQQAEGEQQQVAPPKGGFQRRIDKLVREKADKEREAEYWREQALRSQSTKPLAETVDAKVEGKPAMEDYERHADYLEALTDWKIEQRDAAREATKRQEQQKTKQSEQLTAFQEKQKEFRAVAPDYDEVLAEAVDVPMTAAMMDEVQSHEHGAALLYHLAKNPDEAVRLSKLTPMAVAREVARMESKFIPKEETAAENGKQAVVTRAPKPPTPVGSRSQTAEKDPGEMSPAEYREYRKKAFPNLDR